MSYMSAYYIDGFKFIFSDFGIMIDPKEKRIHEDGFLDAFDTAYEVYDIINDAHWITDFCAMNLDGAPDEFFADALEKIEQTEAQDRIDIWPHLQEIIDKVRQEYQDRKNGGRISSKAVIKRKPKSGIVYLLQSGEFYKIGITTQPIEKRVKQIQSSMPHSIHVLHTIRSIDIENLEAGLHKRFKDSCVNGEWFRLSQDDINHICSIEGVS
jgi:hypothetical protein